MTVTLLRAAALSLVLATSGVAFAQGNKTGHETESGQGNLNNDNVKNNPGTKTVSGPKGQIDKENYDCNNCTSSGPGNSNR